MRPRLPSSFSSARSSAERSSCAPVSARPTSASAEKGRRSSRDSWARLGTNEELAGAHGARKRPDEIVTRLVDSDIFVARDFAALRDESRQDLDPGPIALFWKRHKCSHQ